MNVYPYNPHVEQDEVALGRPRNRLEIHQARLRHERMIYQIEAARDERAARAGKLDVVRAAIGGALIAAGERIGQEAIQRQREAARYDTVRHA
jgi:hypothetical protein